MSTLPVRVVALEWRSAGADAVEVRHARTGAWVKYGLLARPIFEALDAGAHLRGVIDRLQAANPDMKPSHVKGVARSIVFALSATGAVDIDLPPVPPVFGGRYERVKELGRGGMGVAWLCRDAKEPERGPVVVKHAWNFLNRLERCEAGIRREATVMRAFDHPALVRYLDEVDVDGRYHLVREFVDGDELSVFSEAPPPAEERDRIARGIAEALAHVHERGYLFLDLKPTNFMLEGPDRRVRVADVGLCREIVDDRVALKAPTGSRGFAAPEVVAEYRGTTRSDVFGLGRMYYYLVTGRKPRQNDSTAEVVAKMRERGASEREVAIVAALAADDPRDRPADMREALALLR